jgi:hypothetical protein
MWARMPKHEIMQNHTKFLLDHFHISVDYKKIPNYYKHIVFVCKFLAHLGEKDLNRNFYLFEINYALYKNLVLVLLLAISCISEFRISRR